MPAPTPAPAESAPAGPGQPAIAAPAATAPAAAAAPSAPTARRQETRARLLEAATAVFAEIGLQGASVEAICTRAGFTRGAFYSNFESKEQLFLALLERESEQRAADLAAKARELEPELRGREGSISADEAARYVTDFLAPSHDQTTWFVVETEFQLLAMRDPSIAPGHHEFWDRFYASIAGLVEQILAAAGRRFTIPLELALPALSNVYERALRSTALGGPGPDELGTQMAQLLFALTEPVGPQPSGPQPNEGTSAETA